MRYTVFDTPVIHHILHVIAILFLRCVGWRKGGVMSDKPKYVVACAFHTSNWDFPIGIALAFDLGVKISWMGKDSLFRGPFRWLFLWLGGIPIDRSKHHNSVAQMIEEMKKADRLILVITPEGTRSKRDRWKTGFYHIAVGAGVPIQLCFLDYARRVGGAGPMFTPSGNIEANLQFMREFYSTITAKHPEKATMPSFSTQDE